MNFYRTSKKESLNLKTITILCCLMVLAILIFDQQTTLEIAETEHQPLRWAASYITDIALGGYWFSVALVFYITAWIAKDIFYHTHPRWIKIQSFGVHLFLSLLTSGILVILLKFLLGRERPDLSDSADHLDFSPFNFSATFQSFPSGHTQVIFCVATLFGIALPKWQIPLFLFALLIAATRVLILAHFVSDVIAGVLFGVYGTLFSIWFWSKWFPPKFLKD